jgi:hypothetical protein
MALRNLDTLPDHYTVSQPRRPNLIFIALKTSELATCIDSQLLPSGNKKQGAGKERHVRKKISVSSGKFRKT